MSLNKISLLSCLILLGMNTPVFVKDGIIKHVIYIHHPGISLTEKTEQTLIQVKGQEGGSDQFYMDVETVVCGDSQCRVDTVRVFWNALGFYDRLDLPAGVELEKAGGMHFSQEDYQKLDEILANKNSNLKDVYKTEVVGTETSEGVDAMTGATIILNNNDYVKGAVWTCYTLWHWVNGEIQLFIRDIVGNDMSVDALAGYLRKGSAEFKVFALEQIIKRKAYQSEILELVLSQAKLNDYFFKKMTLDYLERGPGNLYFSSIEQLLDTGNPQLSVLCLSALLQTKHPASLNFFERLSDLLSQDNIYQEINLFLKVLEERNTSSLMITQRLIPFLDNENFIIARRVYWFLEKKELSRTAQLRLEAFYRKHSESL